MKPVVHCNYKSSGEYDSFADKDAFVNLVGISQSFYACPLDTSIFNACTLALVVVVAIKM